MYLYWVCVTIWFIAMYNVRAHKYNVAHVSTHNDNRPDVISLLKWTKYCAMVNERSGVYMKNAYELDGNSTNLQKFGLTWTIANF